VNKNDKIATDWYVQIRLESVSAIKKRRHSFSTDCRCKCTQFIWIFSVQEFVLLVMGDMPGVLPDCIQEDALCLKQVGGADNGSGANGKSS
jgi:hypothetical protein